MIIEMVIFHVLGFPVNNHSIRLVGIISSIKQFALLCTAICTFSQTSNTGREIKMGSSADIKWLIKTTNLSFVEIYT